MKRREAIAAGLKKYLPDRPCKKGHLSLRSVVVACLECNRVKNRQYYQDHLDDRKESSRKWREINKEKAADYAKKYGIKWRLENIDKVRKYTKDWRAKNPEGQRAIDHRRRARKVAAAGAYSADDVKKIVLLQKWKCAYCQIGVKKGHHVDHVIPLCLGGANGKENLQILCPTCNLKKQAKHPIDWANEIGLLL